MRPRPAMQKLPAGNSLLTVGFSKLCSTFCELKNDYYDVFIFLCGLCFWCAQVTHARTHADAAATLVSSTH